ncbi:MAG TPA: hypothetical protein VGR91_08125, partial [Stellaceae bacterium]|nr:hypothetical protein [Stellaceae bacterium]
HAAPGAPPPPAAEAGEPAPTGPTARLCLVMARLEEAEHGGEGRMREWLDRIASAVPDPCHVCANCGEQSLEWRSLCPACGGFDTLAWLTPARARFAELMPAAAAAAKTAPSPAAERPIAALPAAAGEC